MRKFWIYVIIIFQLGLIVSLVRGIQVSWAAKDRVDKLQAEKSRLEAEKKELEARYEYVQSQEYLDKVARDELHMAKEGETIVIIPEELVTGEGKQETEEIVEKANWEKWWEVLFDTMY